VIDCWRVYGEGEQGLGNYTAEDSLTLGVEGLVAGKSPDWRLFRG
jgi:hypothetical protein